VVFGDFGVIGKFGGVAQASDFKLSSCASIGCSWQTPIKPVGRFNKNNFGIAARPILFISSFRLASSTLDFLNTCPAMASASELKAMNWPFKNPKYIFFTDFDGTITLKDSNDFMV
jgi:hypothetical protein